MDLDRRRLLELAAAASAGAAFWAAPGLAAPGLAAPAPSPIGTLGLDATHFGLRAGASEDQSRALQDAIDAAARTRVPLAIPPGVYRVGEVRLPAGAQITGVRGATQ